MATPLVSAIVALVKAAMGDSLKTQQALLSLLERHAKDVGPVGRDRQTGWGLIDPRSMIQPAKDPPAPVKDKPTLSLGPVKIYVPSKAGQLFSVGL